MSNDRTRQADDDIGRALANRVLKTEVRVTIIAGLLAVVLASLVLNA